MKLLVTGGTGFLGRALARAALADGHQVVATSRHPERVKGLPEAVQLVKAEVTDAEGLARVVRTAAPEALIHAAAVVTDDDPRLVPVNVEGTRAVLAAAAGLATPPRLVHVSTFAVEDIPPTAYSESKLAAEALVRASELPWVILRPTLIYGPGDGTNTPALVERMKAGSHWLPAGGRARIQPVFVDDVAGALLAAATREGVTGGTYRLGGPEPVSVRAYREAVRDASGGSARVRSIPMPVFGALAGALSLAGKGGARQVQLFHLADHAVDIEDSRRDLGFAPRSLAEGLAATFAGG